MTLWGRDASDFDATVSYTNLSLFTHKSSEGIHTTHTQYGPRLTAARTAGVPVLGSYHVVRTPNASNGSLAEQLKFWVSRMDSQTPWWRTHPHWVLQIDAEKWPYDAVSASTVLQFAALLVDSGLPGWPVTYASRGQYGDTLRGIRTPLWNANYSGSKGGTYPGDGWTPGWAPYSGQTPVLLQYTSTPHDANAFRGSLDGLKALITGGDDVSWTENLTNAGGKSAPAGRILTDTADRVWLLGKRLDATDAVLKSIAAKVDIDPAELERITAASREGAASAGDQVAAAVLAALPDGPVSRADLVAALREVLREGVDGVSPAS
jgi:hypothetical protein